MRFLFGDKKKHAGWLAIGLAPEGVYVAHIKRVPAAMPAVELLAFQALEKTISAEVLEKLAKDMHTARYHCTTVLSFGEYQMLSLDAPNVPQDELKTAARWKLKDMLDFHIDDATIDVLDVPIDKNAPVRNHSMYAVAARNHLIEQRQTLFTGAGIPLAVIDIPEMAQRNISALLESEGRGAALLSFDAEGGLLTVTYSGELYLSRRIDVTLAQLGESDVARRNSWYDRITLEIQRSLDHFDRQYHFIAISKLMLAPVDDLAGALRDYLAANLYIPIEMLNLESILDISRVPELKALDAQRRYFMTLGAALRHEERAP